MQEPGVSSIISATLDDSPGSPLLIAEPQREVASV
jgi:hypothetical protein